MNAYGPILVRASNSAGELAAKEALKKQMTLTRASSSVMIISRKPRLLQTFKISELPPEVIKLVILPMVASKFILLNKHYQKLVLDLMLSNPHRYNHNDLLYNYVKHNNLNVVERILTKSAFANPSAKRNKIVREAIRNGNIDILQLLIEHPKYNSNVPLWDVEDGNNIKNYNTIDYASKQNQAEITKLLIEEHSYLIEAKDTLKKALRYAVMNHNVELARYILSKPTQKPQIKCSKSEEILIPMPLVTKKIDEDLYTTTANKIASAYTYKKPVNPKIETSVEDEESIKLIRIAAKSGSPEMLKELIRHFKYSIETVYEITELAAHEGHIGIIKTLVEKFEIEPAHEKNKILRIACLNGHAALAKFLFQYPNVTYFRGDIMNIFADCCRSDREDCQVISILITQMNINLGNEIEPRHFFSDLRKQGRLKVLTLLQTYYTQNKMGSTPLHLGGPRLQAEELKKLLLDTVNIRHDNLLLDFIESGDTDFVKLILRNSPIIKPSQNNNNALKQAILCNNSEMVKILIGHPKIDLKVLIKDKSRTIEGIDRFPVLSYAVVANRPHIVKEILNSNKKHAIDINEQNNFALRMAVKLNFIDIVKFLLKFPYPSLYNDSVDNPLNNAVENNNEEMILLLARDKRFTEQLNPASKIMAKAFETAAQFGHVSVVKLFIDTLRIDPGSCHNDALKIACSDPNHIQIVKLLLSYQTVVDNKKKLFNAFLAACASGNHEIVKLFMNVIDKNEAAMKSRSLLKELKKRKLWHVIDVLMADETFSNNSPFVW